MKYISKILNKVDKCIQIDRILKLLIALHCTPRSDATSNMTSSQPIRLSKSPTPCDKECYLVKTIHRTFYH